MPTLPTAIQEIEQELEKTITMLHALSHIARHLSTLNYWDGKKTGLEKALDILRRHTRHART